MSELYTLPEIERTYEMCVEGAEEHEQRELACGAEPDGHHFDPFLVALRDAVNADGGEPDRDWKRAARAPEGDFIPGGGQKVKTIRGMGTVYDWRGTAWSQPNGGQIIPRLGVQHIPVIHNVNGIADLITLRNVLVAQRLMVQQGTDLEGNVALYTHGNRLCWQARGANQVSWGTEHMKFSTSEAWSKRQLRASAWIIQLNRKHYGTGRGRASLGAGAGVVRVIRGGQTTHMRVSQAAGFNDRSDPGAGYDFEYVDHCVTFFEAHGHFEGA
jgi:hypothetical protein